MYPPFPTLLRSGEDNPITPPADARLAARTLARGSVLIFPGMGHGAYLVPRSRCPTDIVQAFFADPSRQPDTTCLTEMAEPAFALPAP